MSRPKATFHLLNEINWYYKPELYVPTGKSPSPQMDVTFGRDEKTGKKVAIRFRWTFKYYSNLNLVLSYIAEQDIGIENPQSFQLHDIKRVVWESWITYSDSFFKKAKEQDIKVGFSLFDMTDEQLERLLQSLKE